MAAEKKKEKEVCTYTCSHNFSWSTRKSLYYFAASDKAWSRGLGLSTRTWSC